EQHELPPGRSEGSSHRSAKHGGHPMSHEKYDRLIETARALDTIPTAVAHPCDASSLSAALDAARLGLIRPILVGPRAKIEAAALCKMADRGQITGGILDGPLALDNAIDMEAAGIKKIVSPVAGRANVLIVPNLEAGNMLAKSLSFLAQADSAGIVLGAQVPI